MLLVHYSVGILVLALAALSTWVRTGRRITLWVLTLQIALGIYLLTAGLRAPNSSHYALAVVGWFGLMAANASRLRERPQVGLVLTVISVLCIAGAFWLGYQAAAS